VQRLSRGDGWAREAMYRKYFSSVWGLVLRLLRNRADTEDTVQDVFAIAFGDLADLRDPEALRPWLMKIAVHQVHRRFRRRKLLRLLGLDRGADEVTLESLAHPGLSVEARAEVARLDQVLGALAAPQRIAWSLRYIEGCSLEEVAEACACSLATAKRRIKDATTSIKKRVSIEESTHG
jgi:RNA polymerase sigma-70 factor (ECF subfamily)